MAEFWSVAAGAVCLKLLFLPAYKSTDFDVHRNWLAITHSLPVRKWYFEDTSEWTLDYPPLFAWFEYLLSQIAVFFDPEMLKIENTDYASSATVVFQRLSVIVSDIVFLYAVKEFCQKCLSSKKVTDREDIFSSQPLVLATMLILNFGLLIVDHVHFQYNGFLFGFLLLSVVRIYEGRNLSAAFWFSVLLNFKHIYLYVAPAYFVHLLRCHVFQSNPEDGSLRWRSFSITRLIMLGLIVISVFGLSFGPFILLNQVPQVLSRLFPFKRGLCHAYWAPNFWVFYNVADKVLNVVGTRLGLFTPSSNASAVMTGGLVQEFQHSVLPSVPPLATVTLTALAMMPCLILLWYRPKGPQSFLRALILCAYSSFMFGWHVHEKAVLLIIIPMSLLIMDKKRDAQLYLVMSTVGHYSLFPLLFTPAEGPVKVLLLLLTTIYAFTSLGNIYRFPWTSLPLPLLSLPESIYLLGIIPLETYSSIIHPLLGLSGKLPFLPLLLTSLYCAVGVTYCWIKFYWMTYQDKPKFGKQS